MLRLVSNQVGLCTCDLPDQKIAFRLAQLQGLKDYLQCEPEVAIEFQRAFRTQVIPGLAVSLRERLSNRHDGLGLTLDDRFMLLGERPEVGSLSEAARMKRDRGTATCFSRQAVNSRLKPIPRYAHSTHRSITSLLGPGGGT